jgi:LuxR family maltose regulon positive regulatory protein
LVLTKLYPPVVRPESLRRPDLIARLDAASGRSVILVAAPAGYGKTTLLSRWVAERPDDHLVAWVTTDQADDDPIVLWTHIVSSLKRVVPGLGDSVAPDASGPSMLVDVVLPRLVNLLDALPAVTLVLDDFHRVSSAASRESVAWFLQHAPRTFQLIISTRTDPRLPLAALRARGELVEIRSDLMRFTPLEASDLLNDRLGLGLATEDVASLVERTEGWPAGLYLAALSMGDVTDRSAFVARFGASNRHVLDFLVDEVLASFDEETQRFMLRTSVLERLSGPLCDAVTEGSGSAGRLAEIARTNLFLVPLDDRGEWYRFHHLFGQLVSLELTRQEPDLLPSLHRRASAWHATSGTMGEAIGHALDGDDLATAAELIEGSWIDFTNACRFETLRGWLRRFPDDMVQKDVALLLVDAWVSSLCAMRARAARAIESVERSGDLRAGPLPDGFSSVEASLTVLQAVFPWGDVGAQLRAGRRTAELEPPNSRWQPMSFWAVGMGSFYRGELTEADRSFDEAFALGMVSGQWLVAGSSLAFRSLVAGEAGRLDDQHRLAAQATEFAEGVGIGDVAGEVHLALGSSLIARGRPGDALPLLERGVRVLRSWGQPIDLAEALLRLAPALLATGDRIRGEAAIVEARGLVDSCPDPGNLRDRLKLLDDTLRGSLHGDALTERELGVLRLLAGKASERQIAADLFVSPNTVHSQVRAVFRKLDVTSRAAAVRRGRELGLV